MRLSKAVLMGVTLEDCFVFGGDRDGPPIHGFAGLFGGGDEEEVLPGVELGGEFGGGAGEGVNVA